MIVSGERAEPHEVARFRVETEAVALLQHPNVVTIYEVGEIAGQPFFSMEYCPGGSLASVVGGRRLHPRDACSIVQKLADGVAAAHAAGLVHRDLKPQNILLAADGTPKVSDFGLAKHLRGGRHDGGAGLTKTGVVLGTPHYMAPEQAFGDSKHVGPQADVYALGAILYTLLAGQPPFVSATPVESLVKVVTEEPEPLATVRKDVPYDLEAVCRKCLEKDQRKRYPTAAELAADLSCVLEGEPISVGRRGVLGRMIGALDRVHLQDRFAAYSVMMLLFAPIMLLQEVWVTLAAWNDWPLYLLPFSQMVRLAAILLVIGYFRGWRWLPQGLAERQLWMTWGGCLICGFSIAVGIRLAMRDWSTSAEVLLYPALAALTAMAFFTLATSFWGYCALIGVGFLLLIPIMAINFWFAPLEFGVTWFGVLVLFSTRLRSLKTQSGH